MGRKWHGIPSSDVLASCCDASAVGYGRNLLVGTSVLAGEPSELRVSGVSGLVLQMYKSILPRLRLTRTPLHSDLCKRLSVAAARLSPAPVEPPGEPVRGNLQLLREVAGLDEPSAEILQLLLVQRMCGGLEEITNLFERLDLESAARFAAIATARPIVEVRNALSPTGRLVASGLVTVSEDPGYLEAKLEIPKALVDLVAQPDLDRKRLFARLVPMAPAPTLALQDYAHLAGEVDTAQRLLASAVLARRPGVNILLHGPSGTGKTELARLLAAQTGYDLHMAGCEDDEGDSASATKRLAGLLLGNRLLCGGQALLLFDEMEDVFERSPFAGLVSRRDRAQTSKQWLNLLLETNAVPTLWISNDISGVDPAYRRRFSYAIEFPPLGPARRRRVWERHLGPAPNVTPADVEALAQRYDVSAGTIATALHSAELVAGEPPDLATIERVVAPLERLVAPHGRPRPRPTERPYRLDGACASMDLGRLADQLAGWRSGSGGLSMCLYGPPGTGKSEFVHYLARRMDRPLVVKRVSDILSMWVGEAERHLREAFEETASEGAVLLFDEADSFLQDRRNAARSWEVTQVNEFLQQLEAHPGVVACTTNLFRGLDQAALRRFVLKIAFQPLDAARSVAMFRGLLEPLLAPGTIDDRWLAHELGRLSNLTPGDFAVVARRIGALGRSGAVTPTDLLAELGAEAGAKESRGAVPGY